MALEFKVSSYFLSSTRPTSGILDLLCALQEQSQTSSAESDGDLWTSFFQKRVLDLTIHHPKAQANSPAIAYQKEFIKAFIKKLEEESVEVLDDVYGAYSDLLMKPSTEEMFNFRTYLLDEKEGSSVTLQESKALVLNGTTGLQSWEAAKYLAEWCCQEKYLENKNVLELGCGVGLTGLVSCTTSRPAKYIFTDGHPTVLDVLHKNIKLNHTNCSTQIQVRELDWETEADMAWSSPLDVILAADVVFDPSLFPGLVKVLKQLLDGNTGSEALLACTVRNIDSLNAFLNSLVSSQMKFEQLIVRKLNMFFYGSFPVNLYRVAR